MEPTPITPDLERELRDLRARAYGPEPDIQDDAQALARLIELEAERAGRADAAASSVRDDAYRANAAAVDTAPVELVEDRASDALAPESESAVAPEMAATRRHRLTSSRAGRFALAAGAGVAALAVVWVVTRLLGPHPDATLALTGFEADDQILTLMEDDDHLDIDLSTLESFETFRGVEPWTALDAYGNPCLILVERSTNTGIEATCTPAEADLLTDIGVWPIMNYDFAEGLPDGSIIRFHLREEVIDVNVYPAPEPD